MDILPLAPFPCEKSEQATGYRRVHGEGFVDEAVVLSVIAKGAYDRVYVRPEEMVLSSSEDDFAGWALPVASPFRSMTDVPVRLSVVETRLPAAPSLDGVRKFSEPGLDEPHRGSHRWWLFGMSGAMTCGILSLTLLSLAQRANVQEVIAGYTSSPRKAQPAAFVTSQPEVQPALVRVLPLEGKR